MSLVLRELDAAAAPRLRFWLRSPAAARASVSNSSRALAPSNLSVLDSDFRRCRGRTLLFDLNSSTRDCFWFATCITLTLLRRASASYSISKFSRMTRASDQGRTQTSKQLWGAAPSSRCTARFGASTAVQRGGWQHTRSKATPGRTPPPTLHATRATVRTELSRCHHGLVQMWCRTLPYCATLERAPIAGSRGLLAGADIRTAFEIRSRSGVRRRATRIASRRKIATFCGLRDLFASSDSSAPAR